MCWDGSLQQLCNLATVFLLVNYFLTSYIPNVLVVTLVLIVPSFTMAQNVGVTIIPVINTVHTS